MDTTIVAGGMLPQGLTAAINALGSHVLDYALALAAIGTLAMGVLEMAKNLLRARLRFNRERVAAWTGDVEGVDPRGTAYIEANLLRGNALPVLAELELLAVGAHRDSDNLYDQPVEKMMGQIQAAANLALEYPDEYPQLYGFLTKVPASFWTRGAHDATQGDGAHWRDGVALVRRLRAQATDVPMADDEAALARHASAARARLNNLVARKLDAFQNQTQYAWERLNQRLAALLGSAIFLAAIAFSDHYHPADAGGWALALLLALPVGVVSPFAKQLAGSLAQFGK